MSFDLSQMACLEQQRGLKWLEVSMDALGSEQRGHMWNLKYKIHQHSYERKPDRLVVAKGQGIREGRNRSLGLAEANYYT